MGIKLLLSGRGEANGRDGRAASMGIITDRGLQRIHALAVIDIPLIKPRMIIKTCTGVGRTDRVTRLYIG